jgi:hypothetical protein
MERLNWSPEQSPVRVGSPEVICLWPYAELGPGPSPDFCPSVDTYLLQASSGPAGPQVWTFPLGKCSRGTPA